MSQFLCYDTFLKIFSFRVKTYFCSDTDPAAAGAAAGAAAAASAASDATTADAVVKPKSVLRTFDTKLLI